MPPKASARVPAAPAAEVEDVTTLIPCPVLTAHPNGFVERTEPERETHEVRCAPDSSPRNGPPPVGGRDRPPRPPRARLASPRAMSRCLALAWLACLAAILVQLSAPFEIVPARDEASSTLSCTACALILRDVSIFLRHAPRATLDDIARARDGDVDVDFKVRLRASGLSRRRSARERRRRVRRD